MKRFFLPGLLLVLCSGMVFASDADFVQFQQIINDNCSQCHTRERIESAMQQGVNYDEMIAKMIRLGAKVSSQEQQVLGIFWTEQGALTTEPAPSGPTVASDPLGEFRAVLESRCTGCHTLDRVEKAMMEGDSIDDLMVMMRARGAIISPADKNILGTFWGEALKRKPQ